MGAPAAMRETGSSEGGSAPGAGHCGREANRPSARWWAAGLVAAALVLGPPPSGGAQAGDEGGAGSPTARVEGAVEAVLAVLREPGGGRDARWRRIAAVLGDSFDFEGMTRRVLATEWRRATAEERRKFAEYFSQYLEATFRTRLESYTDQRVEYVSESLRGPQATVETVVVSGEVRTPVVYKLQQVAGESGRLQWRAYDVVIEGVSLVANYRSTFAAIAKSEGMAGVIADVERRIERYRSEAAEGPAPGEGRK